jgi:uncharacterized membrane protein
MATALAIFILVLTNAAGDVFIARGMKEVGDVSAGSAGQALRTAGKALRNRDFLLGFILLVISFSALLSVLSWADLSVVAPATSLVYVVTVIAARFFLNERIDWMRWAGTLLVCLGVALVCLP